MLQNIRPLAILAAAVFVPATDALASSVTYFPGMPGLEPPSAVYMLDFTAFPPGLPAPFAETVDRLTVTYTPLVPGTFATQSAAAIPTEPAPDPVLLGSSPVLFVSFDAPVYGIAAAFLTQGPGPIVMDLLSGGTVVGTVSATGAVPPGLVYPEGLIGLIPACVCANYFDSVVFTDLGDPAFAIRYLEVFQNLPEPSGIGLLAASLGAFAMLHRQRQRTRREEQ